MGKWIQLDTVSLGAHPMHASTSKRSKFAWLGTYHSTAIMPVRAALAFLLDTGVSIRPVEEVRSITRYESPSAGARNLMRSRRVENSACNRGHNQAQENDFMILEGCRNCLAGSCSQAETASDQTFRKFAYKTSTWTWRGGK